MLKSFMAFAVLVATAATAWAQPPPRPLLAVTASYEIRAHGVKRLHESFVVATDRHVDGFQYEYPSGTVPYDARFFRVVSAAAPYATLQSRLRAAQVVIMPSACTTDPSLATTGSYFLTWYGNGRVAELRITVENTPEPFNTCPPQVAAILAAVRDFLRQSVGANLFDVGRSIPTGRAALDRLRLPEGE